MFANLTHMEGKRLVAPYVGRWMEVEGKVDDVRDSTGFVQVAFERVTGQAMTLMYFRGKEWRQRVELLRRGDHLRVQGRINGVEAWGVDLDVCEIVDEPRAASR
jgi:hypothetical protein